MADPDTLAFADEAPRNGDHLHELPTNPEHHPDVPSSPIAMIESQPQPDHSVGLGQDANKAMDAVLYSDVGVNALLTRLKQSIATAHSLAGFLKKRSTMEDEHSKALRRLCQTTFEGMRSRESRQGSYGSQFEEVIRVHEKMADNEMTYGLNLHQMSVDLDTLAHDMERGRKQWKTTGLSAESRVQEAERALDKAKQKYNALAVDYDHAKSGDKVSGRHIGFRPKSGAALEEDLYRKLGTADEDYQGKVSNAQALRQDLITSSRPQAVQALLQLIRECDSGVTLQLQKFTSFNEKLLLGNGLLISPLSDGDSQRKGMRDVVGQIDNERDLHSYVTSHAVPAPRENKYEKHPTLLQQAPKPMQFQPQQQPQPMSPAQTTPQRESQPPPVFPMGAQGPTIPQQTFGSFDPMNEKTGQNSAPYPVNDYPPQGPSGRGYPHPSSNSSYGPGPGGPPPNQYGPGAGRPPSNQYDSTGGFPPRGGLPSGPGPIRTGPGGPGGPGLMGAGHVGPMSPQHQSPGNQRFGGPPARPVFGVDLNDLFIRDQSPVPMVIYQCIQAVDHFGLDVEGIYRVSGNTNQVNQLKAQFDNGPVDFRIPEAFFHDVNNPANLLKQFLRELPDPLFTRAAYDQLLDAANVPDDVQRRDRLHAIINGLPDPNYATLRAVTLHLNRVIQHSERNRMNANSLSVIFAPTIMGPSPSGQIQDASLQHRAIETVLVNSLQIFDED
ncbi:RhoGAP-domain-containing protein [Microthyrium microscopicum]|uniref:RhoGAP-domain-containing protein n=1 Tax=Microthyrium microscopicum TaxID=703497 RepID=A0A6A6URS5_9PEZI|nr:RhoGAP-domain-containing protein [Microthyrium microscopicum]